MELTEKRFGAYLASIAFGAVLLFSAAQVQADDDDDDDRDYEKNRATITEIVAASGGDFDRNSRDYDILLNAVIAAGLADALADPNADYTVFAPNDRSFIRLARDLGFRGHDEAGAFDTIVQVLTDLSPTSDPIPLLTDVLLYHVADGALTVREVRYSEVIETLLDGGTIVPARYRLLDADPDFRNPWLLKYASNIKASNGIVHTINRVLIPADLPNTDPDVGSIVDIVAKSGGKFDFNRRDFDLLLTAVQTAGLGDVLADPNADWTVFAPTDAAFISLARSLGYRGFRESKAFDFIVDALTELGNGDPIPLLTNILLYHVSPGSQVVKDVILAESIETALPGETFHPDGLSLEDNASKLRDPRLSLFSSDIRASNGIIHTINRVLIPVDIGH